MYTHTLKETTKKNLIFSEEEVHCDQRWVFVGFFALPRSVRLRWNWRLPQFWSSSKPWVSQWGNAFIGTSLSMLWRCWKKQVDQREGWSQSTAQHWAETEWGPTQHSPHYTPLGHKTSTDSLCQQTWTGKTEESREDDSE